MRACVIHNGLTVAESRSFFDASRAALATKLLRLWVRVFVHNVALLIINFYLFTFCIVLIPMRTQYTYTIHIHPVRVVVRLLLLFINAIWQSPCMCRFNFYEHYFIRVFISSTFWDLNGHVKCTLYGKHNGSTVVVVVFIFCCTHKRNEERNERGRRKENLVSFALMPRIVTRRIECANDTTFRHCNNNNKIYIFLSWSSHCDREMYEAAVK